MGKKKKINDSKDKLVKSINNNVRSSTRKLNPILRAIVGKNIDIALRDLTFSEKVRFLKTTSTFFPTIAFNIGFSFLVLDLTLLFIDFTSLSLLSLIFFFFPISI